MKGLIESNLRTMESTYRIKIKTVKVLMVLPLLTVFLFTLILMFPGTREFGQAMLRENNLIELLTFLFLLMGGIKGLFLTVRLKKTLSRYEVIFYTLFSLGLLVVAMEEIAWGQWFFGFDTPMFWKHINMQGETTLHNVRGMQGHTEILRLIFGVGGIAGVFLSGHSSFQNIGSPFILFSYFIVIIIFSGLDLYADYYTIHPYIDYGLQRMSEVVEMLIGISSFLYIWLNKRRFRVSEEQNFIKLVAYKGGEK